MTLLLGDCLKEMAKMEEDSIDAIVTDPPYGLGFMGKKWDSLPPGLDVAEAIGGNDWRRRGISEERQAAVSGQTA